MKSLARKFIHKRMTYMSDSMRLGFTFEGLILKIFSCVCVYACLSKILLTRTLVFHVWLMGRILSPDGSLCFFVVADVV